VVLDRGCQQASEGERSAQRQQAAGANLRQVWLPKSINMTPENWTNIISIGGVLLGGIVGALLNHFLEKGRNKDSLILNKKIEIYSSLLIKLNTVFQDVKEIY
jgi:hypothetical protein